MTFEQVTHLAETWGLVLLAILFVAAAFYALWPANRDTFKRAAATPLQDEDDHVEAD
jgi:cytochrome c oxidase cbb3-type subunit 4